jgi:two-component sensor histidine kinase
MFLATMRKLPAFLLPVVFAAAGAAAGSSVMPLSHPCEIRANDKKLLLTPFVETCTDSFARLSAAFVNQPAFDPAFARSNNRTPVFSLPGSAVWMRFALRNPSDLPMEKWIVVDSREADTLETYVEKKGTLCAVQVTGRRFPFSQRPMQFRTYCIPVRLDPHSDMIVYQRIRSTEVFTVPVYVWEPKNFREHDQNAFFLFGTFYGFTIAVLLITIVVFIFSQDRVYLYCSFMLIFLHLLFTLSRQGLAQMFLFQNLSEIAVLSHLSFLSLGQVFGLLLARSFLRYTFKTRWGLRVFYTQVVLLSGAAALPFFADYRASSVVVTDLSILSMATVLAIAIFEVARGNRPALYFLWAWVFYIIGGATIVAAQWGISVYPMVAGFGYEAGLGMELVFISVAIAYGFYIDQKRKESTQGSLIRIRQTALDNLNTLMASKMQELQAKITPHFLFNALTSISELARQDNSKAENAIAMLSSFYRQTMSFSQRKMVRLSEEMELVNAYAGLQKIRFGDRIDYRSTVSAGLADVPVPALIIQPLVENAIKHGISQKKEGGRVEVSAESQDGNMVITVKDDGVGWSAKPAYSGHGLENIMERLDLMYGKNHECTITSNNGVTVRIKIPTGSSNGISGNDN